MASELKFSAMGVRAAGSLLGSDRVVLYCPEEADPADQNQSAGLDAMKTFLAIPLDKLDGAVAPTVNDDGDDGYSVGSRWVDAVGGDVYVCLAATVGAAVWKSTTVGLVAAPAQKKTDATGPPLETDDSGDGYEVGSLWIWPAQKRAWVCTVATENVAQWAEVSDVVDLSPPPLDNWLATAAPTAADDSGAGYSVGSSWLWASASREWVCSVDTVAAAVWVERSTVAAAVQDDFAASAPPTAGDDSDGGWEPGSRWYWPAKKRLWMCESAGVGVAVWVEIITPTGLIKNKLDATAAPTVGDDTGDGYVAGSRWYWAAQGRLWMCANPASGTALWVELATSSGLVKNKFAAVAAPTATDDGAAGYSVGSSWMWGPRLWRCTDATDTAAVWVEHSLHYLTWAPWGPGVDVPSGGINIGRMPINCEILDCVVAMTGRVATPTWKVTVKVDALIVANAMTHTDWTRAAVADLGLTLTNTSVSRGEAVRLEVVVGSGDWQGLTLTLVVCKPL